MNIRWKNKEGVFLLFENTKLCCFLFYIYIFKDIRLSVRSIRKPTSHNSFRLPTEPTSVGKIYTAYRLPDVGGGSMLKQ
jgi:hypothetical protein